MTDQPIESTATEVAETNGNGGALVPAQPATATATLFRTDDPVEVIERATRAAQALKRVLVEQEMIERIGDRDHVKIEGWQTLGGMLGVFASDEWTREIPWPDADRLPEHLAKIRDRGYSFGFAAGFTVKTRTGEIVGEGESECKRTESKWCTRSTRKGVEVVDDFAVKSMAQTRATSRALQAPLRFVVTLAGYSGTPAEEVGGAPNAERPTTPAPATAAHERKASVKPITAPQKGAINARCGKAKLTTEQKQAVASWWATKVGIPHFDRLPSTEASKLIRKLGKDGDGAEEILAELYRAAEDGHEAAGKIVARLEEAGRDA